jgi:hypothetical protein
MIADGVRRDRQLSRDLLGQPSGRDQPQDVDLAVGQSRRPTIA